MMKSDPVIRMREVVASYYDGSGEIEEIMAELNNLAHQIEPCPNGEPCPYCERPMN